MGGEEEAKKRKSSLINNILEINKCAMDGNGKDRSFPKIKEPEITDSSSSSSPPKRDDSHDPSMLTAPSMNLSTLTVTTRRVNLSDSFDMIVNDDGFYVLETEQQANRNGNSSANPQVSVYTFKVKGTR